MPHTTISPKYQVVIPKEIRQEVPLVAGQVLQVIAKNGVISLIPTGRWRRCGASPRG